MFALVFRFPAGRYHATPWGRSVNEGAVAWPPEPYRILRALIAVWHRKIDRQRWDEQALHRLIEALTESLPVYRLPRAVHAHTRHYMPQGRVKGQREDTKLVFDAFFRVDPHDDLVVAWPDLTLTPEAFELAAQLAASMGYLGRAESIVIARATDEAEGPFPIEPQGRTDVQRTSVDVLAPISPTEYTGARPALLERNRDKPKSKARSAFEATVPPKITDALQVETGQLQAAGWSRPPAAKTVSYSRPPAPTRHSNRARHPTAEKDTARFQIARFVLAGRPLPPITDSVKIGEVFRAALMHRFGRWNKPVPAVLSGHDDAGEPLRDPLHAHAFFLPEDHDEDGFIDHLILYARLGLPRDVRRAAEDLQRLWINRRSRDRRVSKEDVEDDEMGRREWRVALEGFGEPAQFGDSALLRRSKVWVSATPYLRPRHMKGGDPLEETRLVVQTECERRGWPSPEIRFDLDGATSGSSIRVGGSIRNVLTFHRFRSRKGLVQPDRAGSALRLEFPEPIVGPVALGFGCHYGLGLFRANRGTSQPISID